ncbi:hypothetical protein [Streptomyces sp. NPDC055287]
MRTTTAALLLAASATLLAGCGDSDSSTENKASHQSSPALSTKGCRSEMVGLFLAAVINRSLDCAAQPPALLLVVPEGFRDALADRCHHFINAYVIERRFLAYGYAFGLLPPNTSWRRYSTKATQ